MKKERLIKKQKQKMIKERNEMKQKDKQSKRKSTVDVSQAKA
jgi:hypothetical protein